MAVKRDSAFHLKYKCVHETQMRISNVPLVLLCKLKVVMQWTIKACKFSFGVYYLTLILYAWDRKINEGLRILMHTEHVNCK